MDLFIATDPAGSDFYGEPAPAPGARAVFVPELLFAAQERVAGKPVPHVLAEDAGMLVHENPRDVGRWPCRLWRVTDVDQRLRWRADTRWFRCRALTVVEEVPSWLVLGPDGERLGAIIDQARDLTQEQVDRIAAIDGAEEQALAAKRGPGLFDSAGSLPYSALEQAARRVGDHLFAWDPDLEMESLDDSAWLAASDALDAAVLAAARSCTAAERMLLARRWSAAMGAHT